MEFYFNISAMHTYTSPKLPLWPNLDPVVWLQLCLKAVMKSIALVLSLATAALAVPYPAPTSTWSGLKNVKYLFVL